MTYKDKLFYSILIIFGLIFNHIIIFNEKFLLLVIFIGFLVFVSNFIEKSVKNFFSNLRKELQNEVFLIEYLSDLKLSDNYLYLSTDLVRQKVFKEILLSLKKKTNFLIIFIYNFQIKKENYNFISLFESLIERIYSFILKKHLYIKLNFIYRMYFYIFYKFKAF